MHADNITAYYTTHLNSVSREINPYELTFHEITGIHIQEIHVLHGPISHTYLVRSWTYIAYLPTAH